MLLAIRCYTRIHGAHSKYNNKSGCLSHADKRITTDNEGYDDTEAGPNVNPYKAPPSGDSGSGELSERLMP